VTARPDSRAYIVGKFLRRHAAASAATAVAVIALLGGLAVAISQAQVARAERDRATTEMRTAQSTTAFLGGIFSQANPVTARGHTVTARDLLDKGAALIAQELDGQPEAQARLLVIMAGAYDRLGLTPQGLALAQQSLAIRERLPAAPAAGLAESAHLVGRLHRRLGQSAEALPALEEAVRWYELTARSRPVPLAQGLRDLALTYRLQGRLDQAQSLLERAITLVEPVAPQSTLLGLIWSNLGTVQLEQGHVDTARRAFERSIAVFEQSNEPDSFQIAVPLVNLAEVLADGGDASAAQPLLERALESNRRILGDPSPGVADALRRLGALALVTHDLVRARQYLEQAMSMWAATDPKNLDAIAVTIDMGRLLMAEGRPGEALSYFRDAALRTQQAFGATHPQVVKSRKLLDEAERAAGRPNPR
jgi:tetratricopeptide (TPR) repeat protein